MTITIFEDKDCKGASCTVTTNLSDLKGTPADKPGSIRMTDVRDAVLMFKNEEWHGGALYLNGAQTVSDLGSDKAGGRFGFGNSIRSIRITPFTVDLNISIVSSGPDLPGIWPTRWWAEGVVSDIVTRANNYLMAQNALLQLNIARIVFRDDAKQFSLSELESWSFPSAWKNSGEIDMIIVDQFSKEGKAGLGKKPCFGKTLIAAAKPLKTGLLPCLPTNSWRLP